MCTECVVVCSMCRYAVRTEYVYGSGVSSASGAVEWRPPGVGSDSYSYTYYGVRAAWGGQGQL